MNDDRNILLNSVDPINCSTETATGNFQKCFRKMFVAAAAALVFGIAIGMACGYSATATENMKISSSNNEVSWIGSILALGALFGGIVAGYLSNKLGQKGCLLFSSVPFLFGWLFIAYSTNLTLILTGRALTGFCVGLVCVTTPSYLVEISTPEVRGLLGASFQLSVVIGVLLATSFGSFLTWRWLAIASAVCSTAALCVMCFVPESPRWLVVHGRYQEAIVAVKFLQGDFLDASAECISINEEICAQPKGRITLSEFLKPVVFKPALMSLALVFFQQACGSNAILFYTVFVFKKTGSSLTPNQATIIIDVVLVLSTALSCVLMDKAGRKMLLLISGIGMGINLAILGAFEYASKSNSVLHKSYGWIPILCLAIYITSFSLGYGPIPWLMMAEMTPVRVRSIICGAATAACWGFTFIVTKTFQYLLDTIDDFGAYWLYMSFCILSCLFTVFLLPETKGKPVEDIQEYFTGRVTNIS